VPDHKTQVFVVKSRVCASSIFVCAGEFEVLPDEQDSRLTYFAPPGLLLFLS